MKNNETKQPTHTKGIFRIGLSKENAVLCDTPDNKIVTIAICEKIEDAKRIVKCVNMHYQLLEEIKQQIIDLKNIDVANMTNYEIRKFDRLTELIKQSEQK